MEKIEPDRKHFFILTLVLVSIFFFHLLLEYQKFEDFTSVKYHPIKAKVLSEFQKITKKGKRYTLLKLQTDNGIKFFGISWQKNLKKLTNSAIKCKVLTKNISFYKYLRGFFAPVYGIKVKKTNPNSLKTDISNYITSQHKNMTAKEIYSTLFLGTKLHKQTRLHIQTLGISHLVAISGFHLGVLSFLIFLVLTPAYKLFQDKFFPYRNHKLDLMMATLFLLFGYLYLVGFIPSLSRAYIMLILGYIFYIRHIKIVSFETLFLTLLLLLAINPTYIFSISFWFSVFGVFYIFLFLYYFKELKPWLVFILINFWVFVAMQPIVHYIFPTFAISQLLSPFLSMIFIVFYPLELFLHLIKEGDLLDGVVLKLLDFHAIAVSAKTPLWFLLIYIATSLLSIYKKIFLYLLISEALFFFLKFLIFNF